MNSTHVNLEPQISVADSEQGFAPAVRKVEECAAAKSNLYLRHLRIDDRNDLHLIREFQFEVLDGSEDMARVIDWDIVFSVENDDLVTLVVRRFLELFNLAKSGDLSKSQKRNWLDILPYVDYSAFRRQYQKPRCIWGKIVSENVLTPNLVSVDGTEFYFLRSLSALSLDWIQHGDYIKADILYDYDGGIESIENVEPINPIFVKQALNSDLFINEN